MTLRDWACRADEPLGTLIGLVGYGDLIGRERMSWHIRRLCCRRAPDDRLISRVACSHSAFTSREFTQYGNFIIECNSLSLITTTNPVMRILVSITCVIATSI